MQRTIGGLKNSSSVSEKFDEINFTVSFWGKKVNEEAAKECRHHKETWYGSSSLSDASNFFPQTYSAKHVIAITPLKENEPTFSLYETKSFDS